MKKPKIKKGILEHIGPGFITGASDDDPSGIATYSQTGAQFGYGQLWTALWSYPFMAAIQEMCGRIGMVTGQGLSGVIKKNYSKKVLYFTVLLLLIANTINIGADLGAMASAAQLVLGAPFVVLLFGVALLTLALEIFIPYPAYAKFLKYLCFSLLSYAIVFFLVKEDWSKVFISSIIPAFSFDKSYLLNIVAILGTTISPYCFFWQADEEVEEEIKNHQLKDNGQGTPKITLKDVQGMKKDTYLGMFFSNLIMFFIIAACNSTLGMHGITSIQTADQAALALKPLAGNFTSLLFAVGIIGTGLLTVPILAGSASYSLTEALNLKNGLNKKFSQAHGFYFIIILSTLVGLLVNFTPIKPFQMLYYTAVINGICAPPLMFFILRIGNNKKIMGQYTNSRFSNIMGWLIFGFMTVAGIALFYNLFAS